MDSIDYFFAVGFLITGFSTIYFYLKSKRNYKLLLNLMRETVVEMDAKDPYFNGHIKSVERLSMELARKIGLNGKSINNLRLAIYLAEIGKIRIPDSIITKRERLTFEELEIVKKHPIIACRMVENLKGMKSIARIVRAHHERFDGEGYPDNMLGKTIPVEARIISIVDSYVAMTSERPYKRSLSENEALEELAKGKNKQFDGAIVDKFVDILKR